MAHPPPPARPTALAAGNPPCSIVAVADLNFSAAAAFAGSDFGAAVTLSLRTKLPLGARPGPLAGRDGSASASTRIAAIAFRSVGATIVYVSRSGSAPDAAIAPSSVLASVT